MVKSVALFAVAGVANADSIALSYTDCGSSSTHAKITDLQPATINVPGKATVVGSGALDADQTGAHFELKVKKGVLPLVSGKGDICQDTKISLPLGAGSFTVKGLDCPAKAGDVSVEVDLDILSDLFEDGENSLLTIHIEATADDTGDQVICLDIEANQAADYDAYLNKFGKAYNGDEYATRKAIYEENMKWIAAENAKGTNTHTVGEGPFTDLTNEEFKALYVSGYKSPSQQLGGLPYLGEHEEVESSGSVDWTTKGAVTVVKDQGQCGSCWAFSTTGGLEGAWEIATGQLVSMSEQQFVDCDTSSAGCNGGNMGSAFQWAEKQNVATESSYAYTAKDGSCKTSGLSTAIPQGGVTGYKSVGSLFSKATVAKLESAIDLNPVSIAIEADQSSFQHYTGGVLSSGCGTNLDHGVLAVGYNTAEGYWLVKNSWGASWGDSGYIMLSQTGNVCGILNQPVYPTVSGSVSV
jgi:cathepsin L